MLIHGRVHSGRFAATIPLWSTNYLFKGDFQHSGRMDSPPLRNVRTFLGLDPLPFHNSVHAPVILILLIYLIYFKHKCNPWFSDILNNISTSEHNCFTTGDSDVYSSSLNIHQYSTEDAVQQSTMANIFGTLNGIGLHLLHFILP